MSNESKGKSLPTKLIQRHRRRVGSPQEIYVESSKLLEGPGSKRAIARGVVFKGKPDILKKESLCNELHNTMYRDELFQIAKDLGLDIYKDINKTELCRMIAEYAQEIPAPPNEDISDIEHKMGKAAPKHMMEFLMDHLDLDIQDALEIASEIRQQMDETPDVDDKSIVNDIATYISSEMLDQILEHYRQLPPFLEEVHISREIMYNIRPLVKEFVDAYNADGGSNEFISKIDWSSLPDYRQ